MALVWSGLRVSPGTLTEEVFTPALEGSYQSAIVGAARRHGRIAYPVSDLEVLFHEVAAGHPVIVLQNLGLFWYPVWHYALVIGYDLRQDFTLLHSGASPRKQLSMDVFKATWGRSRNWGILILPPDRLPVTAELPKFISAVIGLEQAGQWTAAIEGYGTALKSWPSSLAARIGLGNCWYALGQLAAAEEVLREASRQFPDEGVVFNNLAQVLFERHKQQEALEAARRAVELGGSLVEAYRKTLAEIQAGDSAQSQ
jgi:tetratricopeptide (TPR) repeat protein